VALAAALAAASAAETFFFCTEEDLDAGDGVAAPRLTKACSLATVAASSTASIWGVRVMEDILRTISDWLIARVLTIGAMSYFNFFNVKKGLWTNESQ
jgi:hypothetical protein